MKSETVVSYDEICAQSIANPEELWGEAAKVVQWYKPFEKVFDDSKPPFCVEIGTFLAIFRHWMGL